MALIPPPARPLQVGDIAALETSVGITFPGDYRDLLRSYGAGWFCDDWEVWTASPVTHRNLADQQDFLIDALGRSIEGGDTAVGAVNDGSALPIDFEHTDVLSHLTAWGSTSGGEYGFWFRNHPDPNRWPVVVVDFTGRYDYHTGGLVAYLYDLYSNRFVGRQFMPADILPQPPFFTPG